MSSSVIKKVGTATVVKLLSADPANKRRRIRGIASNASIDREGDEVNVKTATWKTPLPLLWAHDHRQPIGSVEEMRVIGDSIHAECIIARDIAKADEVWKMLDENIPLAFSIGFKAGRVEPTSTGKRFSQVAIMELSIVSVPANASAQITGRGEKSMPIKLLPAGCVRLVRASK